MHVHGAPHGRADPAHGTAFVSSATPTKRQRESVRVSPLSASAAAVLLGPSRHRTRPSQLDFQHDLTRGDNINDHGILRILWPCTCCMWAQGTLPARYPPKIRRLR